MKLLILIFCAILELSISIPVKNASAENYQVSKFNKIFPESALVADIQKYRNRSREMIKHHEVKSNDAEKKEYFFISDLTGSVVIINALSYEIVASYYLPELAYSIAAIVGDTFYNIVTLEGSIFSMAIEDMMEDPFNTNWAHVGSFPSESNWIRCSLAIDGSLIYFVTFDGNLYSYDTISRLVTKIGIVEKSDSYASLVVVNSILYIHKFVYFFSFDGTSLNSLTTPEDRPHAGLFQMGNNVCIVGGNYTEVYPDPVFCYNPQDKEWSTPNYINEARWYPGVATTGSKTYVFGGYARFASSNISWFWRDSVEVLDHETNIWSFAPTPLIGEPADIQALAFYF